MNVRIDGAADGETNMRIDRAMLDAARPAARVYAWSPATISLGRSQSEADVNAVAARAEGVGIVGRPTGGGALLHEETEVTYAVVLPRSLVSHDILASYRTLAGGVIGALRSVGLKPSFVQGQGGLEALCYLREEGVSVVVGGKKISGGAQKRTANAVLQHGTLLIDRNAHRMARLVGGSSDEISQKTTCLRELGIDATWQKVAAAMANALTNDVLAPMRPV